MNLDVPCLKAIKAIRGLYGCQTSMASSFLICFSLLAMETYGLKLLRLAPLRSLAAFVLIPAPFQVFLAGFHHRWPGMMEPFSVWRRRVFSTRDPLKACVYACCGSKEQSQLQVLPNFQRQLESRAYPELSHHRWDCWRPCGMKLMDVTQHGL